MKRKLFIMLAIVGTLCFAGQFFTTAANPSVHEKNAFTPDTIQWGPPPPFIAPGAQVAVLEGNPGASTGDYTVRVKMPDGYRIAPALASPARKRDGHLRDVQGRDGRHLR